jgi:lactate dehydrogenase-like 2-hydroxyacid dehydrogenase
MLDHAPELKVLARSGVGYDSIDVAAAAARI